MGESGPEVFVHLLPRLIPPGALEGGLAVVVDVLRATTVMVHALAAGCEAIIPVGSVDQAKAVAASFPSDHALLAGERLGLPIDGFDLGNSPDAFDPPSCRGKTLVMTTTNGTQALLACREARRVGVGALVNLASVTRWAGSTGLAVHLVCAGTDGLVSLEDTLVAGEIAKGLSQTRAYPMGNDSALIALAMVQAAGQDWAKTLARGRGGRRVAEIGLGVDITAASRRDRFTLVPVLRHDPLRLVVGGDEPD